MLPLVFLILCIYCSIPMALDIFSTVADEGGNAPLTLGRFNSEYKKNLFPFQIINQNIRSANKNFDNLVGFLYCNDISFDIMGLTETWERYGEVENVVGYKKFVHSSQRNKSSGVALFIKECWNAVELKDSFIYSLDAIDIVGVQIDNLTVDIGKINFLVCYRSLRSLLTAS